MKVLHIVLMWRSVPNMVRGRLKRGRDGAICRPPSAPRARRPPVAQGPLLDEIVLRLRHVQSAVIVAVAALRRQNCELDEDIASLLQRCVCDSLHDQLEKLEAAPERRRRQRPVSQDTRLTVARMRRI